MSGFNDRLNWDIAYRGNVSPRLDSSKRPFFAPVTAAVTSNVVMIGMRNSRAKSTWTYAGMAYMNAFSSPSSASSFSSAVEIGSQKLRLGTLTLFQAPSLKLPLYYVEIRIPFWHQLMEVEVWQYSGDEINPVIRIETKLDTLIQ